MTQTMFLQFWRELSLLAPGTTLGLAARAWRVTRRPAEAVCLLAPSLGRRT